MKTSTGYELELHHAQHIEEQMSQLHQPAIELGVPSLGETMLINTSTIFEKRPIVIEVEGPGERLTMRRTDMRISDRANMPIQIAEAERGSAREGHRLFKTAVASLTYTRVDEYLWDVDVDESNINDRIMFRDFTGILTRFAWLRQEGKF